MPACLVNIDWVRNAGSFIVTSGPNFMNGASVASYPRHCIYSYILECSLVMMRNAPPHLVIPDRAVRWSKSVNQRVGRG